ncbi:MAG: YdcF family protein [Anaerolineae bacterium]|nr:YdcF family protein [Anaerolineae bacterium]
MIDRTASIDETRSVDAIIVLGAAVALDGTPSQDVVERTRHGVELYHEGWAEKILFTGGQGPNSASNQGSTLAVEMGVPSDAVFQVEGPWDTRGDASYSATLMREHGWHTALLVTHSLHCYRARLFFRQAGIEAYTSPTGSVHNVPQFWRMYYALREAVGVVWPYLNLPDWFTRWAEELVYGFET